MIASDLDKADALLGAILDICKHLSVLSGVAPSEDLKYQPRKTAVLSPAYLGSSALGALNKEDRCLQIAQNALGKATVVSRACRTVRCRGDERIQEQEGA